MIRALGLGSLFFLLSSASVSFAASADLGGFFPGYCRGTPDKAVRAYDAQAVVAGESLIVTFKAALLECLEGASAFVTYAPRDGEFVEVYEIATSAHRPVHASIPAYEEGLNYSLVTFAIPLARLESANAFRVDLFLYRDMIPLKLTISEDGQAALVSLN